MRFLKLLFPAFLLVIFQIVDSEGKQPVQNQKPEKDVINIGLLIQNNNSPAARQGAELAVKMANENGNIKGKKFQLIVRSMEGPWGTGSKEAVSMIFEEKVFALIGSNDGRNAHIVEQVSAKSRIPFISAWASDPTLSQAFVPWFYNCVPNDLQQAGSLIKEIYHRRNFKKVIVVSDKSYDANLAIKYFLKKTKAEGIKDPFQFSLENSEKEFDDFPDRIKDTDAECFVLFGDPAFSWKFIRLIRSRKINQIIYGSLFALGEKDNSDTEFKQNGEIVMVSSAFYLKTRGKTFIVEFEKLYGNKPTEVAAYSFDAANLVIEAIKNAYFDREKIKTELSKIRYEGVTGLIQFDKEGNRSGEPELLPAFPWETIINRLNRDSENTMLPAAVIAPYMVFIHVNFGDYSYIV